jgi:tetratricopeptide (TPR) repeat protein
MCRCGPASLLVLISAFVFRSGPEESSEQLFDRAQAYLRDGDFDKGLNLLDKGRGVVDREKDAEWYWRLRLLHAEILIEQNRSKDALSLLDIGGLSEARYPALAITRRILNARLHLRQSRFDDAAQLLGEAGQLADQYANSELKTEVDLLRGQLLGRQGKIADAENVFSEAHRISLVTHDQYRQAQALNGRGMLLMLRSRCDEAIPFFEQSRMMSEALGADLRTAGAANNLGMCYGQLGDFKRAISYREQAMKLARPSARLSEILGETGTLHLAQGNPKEAIPFYRRALMTARQFGVLPEAARWAGNLTLAMIAVRDWDGAEAALQEALALKPEPRSRTFLDLNAAAIAQGRGKLGEARRIYEFTLIASQANPAVQWQAHSGLASVWSALKVPEEADRSFEAALRIIEENQSVLSRSEHKITFLGRLIQFYQQYVDALIARGDSARALKVADSSRARIMAERLSIPLNRSHPAGAEAFKRIAKDSRSVWLSYWLGPRRSFLWLVSESEFRLFELPPAEELARLVLEYRGFIEKSMRDPLQTESEAGRKLYEVLIAPAAAFLPAGTRVALIPDGILHHLNFETLPVYGANPHYWINDVTLAVAPSFGVFQGHRKHDESLQSGTALVIGDPVSPSPEYPPLPHTKLEIDGLQKHFSPESTILTREAAHPESYSQTRPGAYSFIHIAAHAEVKENSPLDSAIILSVSNSGFKLYARDVMDIPLRAELVTLSACRTSGARTYSGEGLVGFAWAFLRAGAQSVIAGLWDVDDESTWQIMDRMYAKLKSGLDPAAALRESKLELLQTRYAKPYYWGPFQCYRQW